MAGWLMAPYLGWTAYATALTTKLWIDNPSARESEARARLTRAVRRVAFKKRPGGGGGAAPPRAPSLDRPGGKGAAASAAAIEAAAVVAAEKAVAAATAAEGKLA